MAKYQDEEIKSGSSHTRCFEIRILNPLNETPNIEFFDESVVEINGSVIKTPLYSLTTSFNNSQLHQDIYTKLLEVCSLLRTERENKLLNPTPDEE